MLQGNEGGVRSFNSLPECSIEKTHSGGSQDDLINDCEKTRAITKPEAQKNTP